jgi:eukaryotic-like serine/threonine-protein kinase
VGGGRTRISGSGPLLVSSNNAAGVLRADDAAEMRVNVGRAFYVGGLTWAICFLLDLYNGYALYPAASIVQLALVRCVGALFTVGLCVAARRGPASIRYQTALATIGFVGLIIGMALIAVELGGLPSPYVIGLGFFWVGAAALMPSPWQRTLVMTLPGFVAYLAVMAIARWTDATVAAQWGDQFEVARFAGNMLMVAGLAAFSAVGGHSLWTSRHQLYQARRLGRYRLESPIGAGGMNEVWLAWDDLLGRDVALKILRTRSPASAGDPTWLRFEREARATSKLESPHTVRIFDFGASDDGIAFIAMEYLRGSDLDALVHGHGPLAPARAFHFARQAARSLAEAHGRALVHRDIKPANLHASHVAGEEDFLRVLDFGVVRDVTDLAPHLTQEGAMVGTPTFMAPEAFGGSEATARSDIYSLGATLYFLLTGQPPFDGESSAKLWMAHARTPLVPPSLRRDGVPASFERIVLRCLEKEPEARYADGTELGEALDAVEDVPAWGPADARAWWEAARLEVAAGPRPAPSDAAATVAGSASGRVA